MIAPSFEEKKDAIRLIIDALIDDIKKGSSKERAGWRTAETLEISTNVLTVLIRERIVYGSETGFRINLMTENLERRYRELRLKTAQMKYFYNNYDHNQEKIGNQKRILEEFHILEEYIVEDVFSIDEYASIGFWHLLSRTGIPAPIEEIINHGYSPRNWAIRSFLAIPQLVEDLFYDECGNGKIIETFKKTHKFNLILKIPDIEYHDQNEIIRIKQISQWEVVKRHISNEVKLYLGCLWFIYSVLDGKSLTKLFEDQSIDVNRALNELFISIFNRNITQVIEECERECALLETLEHWFSEISILPEGV